MTRHSGLVEVLGNAVLATNCSRLYDVPLLSSTILQGSTFGAAKPIDRHETAALLIGAEVSYQLGEAISESSITTPAQKLQVTVLAGDVKLGSASLDVGSVDNEVPISLDGLDPSLDPYTLTINAELANLTTYSTNTSFSYLPYPDNYGSVARLDNLYGGIHAQRGKNSSWEVIFPYTYYVQWTLYWDTDVSTLDEYASYGFNLVHIVPTGSLGEQPFPWDQFQPYLDRAAELGIWLQYDVIWEPGNTTEMIEQVTALRTHPSILSWYQSDEPDGKGNPTNSTGLAYKKIKELDPYHPISLALNCENFYYGEYAAGADIIVPDVYPISTNTSYSTVYDTVCNSTYGCCGCDNCGIGPTVFDDIPRRLDEFRRRDELIGWAKTQWFAPQAFGNETFWTRYPTAHELDVMTLLAVNHGAKGLTMWDYPTTAELFNVTRDMAALFTGTTAASLFLGAPRFQGLPVSGSDDLDAAAWVDEKNGQAMVSVVNLNYYDISEPLSVALPEGLIASTLETSLWGDDQWKVGPNGSLIASDGVGGLATAVFVVNIS
ncbi:glycoside hydrolase subgroup catalytic core [Diaporthe amygdali]|uniref:glycoside hydrolase subgroup catalytic core n=1 Tax=Phomopsis amygdali TaxID=1214568 RepID=UPI0022FE7675|nr:glycoside hydrolase subgroup catalytic core [Diaporthe amygdali]KAJ0103896.1 glycoside hydrolase subgroup catalytic core [Diaporthe amygdali]